MTRLDRARIALAYEYLRGVRWRHGFGSSFYKGACEFAIDAALHSAPPGVSTQARPYFLTHVPARVLRARLALYLRALLRADAGNFGPQTRRPRPRAFCRSVEHNRYDDALGLRCRSAACDCWVFTRRIRPLWESAPAHRGTT